MQMTMMRGIAGRYVSPVYGGEWTTGRTTLLYSPLLLLPLKKPIIDGTPIPAESAIARSN